MRVLGIDTSTNRTSVALLEHGRLVLALEHARPYQSAERLLPLVARALEETGWASGSLDRLGVSVGPGSFTGLRIGIACAQGLSLGLGIPLLGVSSLCAMARAVPAELCGARCAVLDARRGEVFVAAYGEGPTPKELAEPRALPLAAARATLEREVAGPLIWIGSGLSLLEIPPSFSSPQTDEPHAQAVGLLAEELRPEDHPALPLYLRDAGATLPNLPAPLASE